MNKLVKLVSCVFVLVLALSGCSTNTNVDSSGDVLTLKMAHGISESSPGGEAIAEISDLVDEKSNGSMKLEIYGSGVLGSERDTVEMVQAGVLDMAKVGASSLDAFEGLYGAFSLPYMFDSEEDLYAAMTNTDLIDQLNDKTRDTGFIMIGWYPSGFRNFYTAGDTPIKTPDDLSGMKIRVMESATSKKLVESLGGSPVPMASSETYTAMQQGVIDGAENNELALTSNRHMDVAKSYSYTQHQLVPDIYIISTKTLDKLTDEQLNILEDALWENNLMYRDLNKELINDAIEESKEAGVEFLEVDKTPFEQKVEPMYDEFEANGDDYVSVFNTIKDAAGMEANYDTPEIK